MLKKNEEKILHALKFCKGFPLRKDIVKEAGVSIQTVTPVIEKLETEGIITGYKAVVDWEKLGYIQLSIIIDPPGQDILRYVSIEGLGY
jgi:DNA-binding Lrp family transcriptional regulator